MTFPSGTATVFARCLSAEMRARAGARRITQRALAQGAGFNSHNYLSIRWRDEAPLTADDLERICDFFEITPEQFVSAAVDNHLDAVIAARDAALLPDLTLIGDALAAAPDVQTAAAELWVDEIILKARLRALHPTERGWLRRRLTLATA